MSFDTVDEKKAFAQTLKVALVRYLRSL